MMLLGGKKRDRDTRTINYTAYTLSEFTKKQKMRRARIRFTASTVLFIDLYLSSSSSGCGFVENRDKSCNEVVIGSERDWPLPVEKNGFLWNKTRNKKSTGLQKGRPVNNVSNPHKFFYLSCAFPF